MECFRGFFEASGGNIAVCGGFGGSVRNCGSEMGASRADTDGHQTLTTGGVRRPVCGPHGTPSPLHITKRKSAEYFTQ